MLASSLITAKCWLKKKAHLNRCAFLIEAVTELLLPAAQKNCVSGFD
jgi:hypothetical protein